MSKSIIISERDNIAAVVENNKAIEFFINRGDMLLGDVYLAYVENILPSIDAAFVNLGSDRMGFLHSSDIAGKGPLKDRLKPKQQLLVQIIKEPTGHKGPRVTTSISLPGRFLVFMPEEKGISVSRKIVSAKERSRLKSIVNIMKPPGVGVIIRTEAEGQADSEIQEDIELLLERWNNIVSAADTVTPPNLLYRDQDILYRVIREACTEEVKEIILDTSFGLHRTNQLLQSWNIDHEVKVTAYKGNDSILVAKGIDKEIRTALQTKVIMPSGGYLFIETTEALTVIDVNSGKFTSSATQNETIRRTNLESVTEIARQLKLRNIGGMIVIDFIDMENRVDQLLILESLEMALEPDKAKPQVGQLSDLGLVELTRHRQGQSLAEIFTKKCPACHGAGSIIEEFNFATPPLDTDFKSKNQKVRMPQNIAKQRPQINAQQVVQQQSHHQQQQKPVVDVKMEEVSSEKHHVHHKKPKAFSSVVSAPSNKQIKSQKPVIEPQIEITDDGIKQILMPKGYLPIISKIIKFVSMPPKTVRESMPDFYNRDVFTILQDIENTEQFMHERPDLQRPPQFKPQRRDEINRDELKPVEEKIEEINKEETVQSVELTEEAIPEQVQEFVQDVEASQEEVQPELIIEVSQPESVKEELNVQETLTEVQQELPLEKEVQPEEDAKIAESPKKVVRRGRKPKTDESLPKKKIASKPKAVTRKKPVEEG